MSKAPNKIYVKEFDEGISQTWSSTKAQKTTAIVQHEYIRKGAAISLPLNLDEAAEKYSENILANNEDLQDAIEDAFKEGAEWMAGQRQTDVELEEEITRWLEKGDITDTRFDDYDDADIERTARHFYELSLNAGREKPNGGE